MREIIDATYGAVPLLREQFDGMEGVERVLIYGCWAARRAGEAGLFPNDIDVLVLGSAPRRVLANRQLERVVANRDHALAVIEMQLRRRGRPGFLHGGRASSSVITGVAARSALSLLIAQEVITDVIHHRARSR
ncbi:hypothetical protein [Brachybacterium timonense]|uniref:hypothetical protein n=1 Tax=Brachybacterium timonense TaxID=2050896 RepID=UPI00110E1DC1|nr:hypothetical protein [Brachybacterium timonense]